MEQKKEIGWGNLRRRLFGLLDRALDVATIFMMGALFLLLAYQVICRFIFHYGAQRANEISTYLFVWTVYFGMVIAVKDREHIAISALVDRLRPESKTKAALMLAADGIWLAFDLYIAVASVDLVYQMLSMGGKTGILKILIGYVYLVMPITFFLALVYIIRNLVLDIQLLCGARKGEKE